MLAELAAFNAGFAVVKQVIANGRDLSDAASAIGKMVGAKEDIKRRHNKQKSSVMSFLGGKKENDFEEFMALEKINHLEKEMITYMKIYGRAGLHEDWVSFQAQARRKRRAEEADIKARKAKQLEYIAYVIGAVILITGIAVLAYWVKWLKG
jgi:hypothetical protein|tara:strand:+ start:103 stop:558 length:456 start_codon:yes stop_codon:yes gene_type:complete